MKKIVLLFLSIVLVSCTQGGKASVQESQNNESVTLRFANQHPTDSFMTAVDQEICEKISEATEGRVNFKLYPDSALGDYPSVFEEVMVGSIEMAHTSIPETYGAVMAASMNPYLGTDFDTLKKAYRKDGFLYSQVSDAMNSVGVHTFGFFCEGFNGVATNKEINAPAEVGVDKGVIVRVPTLDTFTLPIQLLGFRTSTIAYADTYTAIQTGVVDGWHGGPPNLNYLYFRDVINHYYYYMMNQEATQIYINQEVFDSFLPEDQEAITRIIDEALDSTYDLAKEDDRKYMDMLEQEGVKITIFTDEERQAIAEAVRKEIWPKLASVMGEDFWINFSEDIGVEFEY